MDCTRWIVVSACLVISVKFPYVGAQTPSGSVPSFTLRPQNKTANLHSTVVFNCKASGISLPTIKWVKYMDGGEMEIRTNGRFIVSPGSSYLFILGTQWADAGQYGCIAQNEHGKIVADAFLAIFTDGPPTWHIKPHNVTLYSGQKYTLPCRTHAYPTARHYWTKNGFVIGDDDLKIGINDLTFTAAKTRHTGLYTCLAYNIYGTVSETVYVKVVSDPSVVIQPENASGYRGTSVTLSCGVVSSDNMLSVNWKKNGKKLKDDTSITFTHQTWQNIQIYSLKIKKIRKRHLGEYHCEVTSAMGSVASNLAKISFSTSVIPLSVTVAQPLIITEEGSDVELMCIFTGVPTPKITWYKDGHKLTKRNDEIIVVFNNKCEAMLTLRSVTPSLAGNYVCKGSSSAGTAEGNISLTVKGGTAPDIKPANQLKVAKKDSNVTLKFVVMTSILLDAHVMWYKDGKQLHNAGSIAWHPNGTSHAELAISSVQYSDSGFYTCSVQNHFGVSSGNVTLTVKGIPTVPVNVTVKHVSLDTVLISWDRGFDGGASCHFDVLFKKSGARKWTSAVMGINTTTADLKNSKGWDGVFIFRVTAVNQFGSSEHSEVSVELKGNNKSQQQQKGDNSSTGAILGGVIGGLLLIAVIIVLVLWRVKWRKAPPKQLPTTTYVVVDERNNTLYDSTYVDAPGAHEDTTGTAQERCDTYSYVTIKLDAAAAMATRTSEYAAIQRPKQWELPKRNVRLDKTLGSGHFGQVLKGFLKTKQGIQVVAVKMLKENADQQQKKEFLAELELMKTMAPHPNIVGLVGCCTKSDHPFIIVEYCSMGNLRNFLRSSHGSVIYANMAGNSLTLTCHDLLSFAWQCARGMSYLASQKLVHRDLAARNILVDKGHVCKIADFGLARDIYKKKQYLKLGEAELPLRWMAIESIFQGITTIKSDVWSFGILLWEIVTLGANPYPAMSRDDLIEQLRVGYRMPKPPFCSDELYAIMWQCWHQDPESRPTFLELGKTLHRLMTAQTLAIDLGNYDRSYVNATEEEYSNQ